MSNRDASRTAIAKSTCTKEGQARLLRANEGEAGSKLTRIELYDTTLRDGEQAAGASFNRTGRLAVYGALSDLGVHYVELGWPLASDDIRRSFADCRAAQRSMERSALIAAFGSTSINQRPDQDDNLRSIIAVNPDVACIFGKSWTQHVAAQLRITKKANLERIRRSVDLLKRRVRLVFYDAEHYFDGYNENPEYALSTIKAAADAGADRLVLCDTNGGTLTPDTVKIVRETRRWLRSEGIEIPLGTHFHNDSGVAVANAYATLRWVRQVQGTINGIGERVGNLNLSTFMAGFVEKMGGALPGIDLTKLKGVVATAYLHSGVPMPKNDPYVGDDAFTHRGGVHQDGVWKLASYEHVNPEKFGNERVLLLNSLGGRRGVLLAAQKFGHDLDKNSKSVILASKRMLEEVREMEMRGYRCGAMEAEQYLLIEKHFGRLRKFVRVVKPSFSTKKTTKGKEISTFTATFVVDGNRIKDSIEVEGGPIDAAFKSYKRVMSRFYSRASGIHLGDYKVVIANEREEASTVRTEIVLHNGIKRFATVGIDANVLMSALEAINKGFNYYLNVAASKQAEESGAANSH